MITPRAAIKAKCIVPEQGGVVSICCSGGTAMSTVIPFAFGDNEIRAALAKDGEPWLVAKDVAEALGYDQTSSALKLCRRACCLDELNKINGLASATKWIPESDVYRLVMRSTLPSAELFQDWVTCSCLQSAKPCVNLSKWKND